MIGYAELLPPPRTVRYIIQKSGAVGILIPCELIPFCPKEARHLLRPAELYGKIRDETLLIQNQPLKKYLEGLAEGTWANIYFHNRVSDYFNR